MKKHIALSLLLLVCLRIGAWTSPVSIPSIGDADIRIVGQNVENYLSDVTASNSSCNSQEDFEEKTNKIANAFLALDADIVAICEVQRDDEILRYIVDEMNSLYGSAVYSYVTDGLYAGQSSSGYQPLKSGFIYRKDKLALYGTSSSPYRSGEYCARLRIQGFKEIASGEVFTLSVNHFKAKDSSVDAGENTRLQNVSNLISALGNISYDDDILIMGDLNAYSDETPIQNLVNAGYEEQLLRFTPNAYSYIYKGTKGLLDHALASETMAAQVTGANVYHINTSGSYYYRYSDHDCTMVGVSLGKKEQQGDGIHAATTAVKARKIMNNGTLYILVEDRLYDLTGQLISQ